jgi:hypothetical protein
MDLYSKQTQPYIVLFFWTYYAISMGIFRGNNVLDINSYGSLHISKAHNFLDIYRVNQGITWLRY